MASNVLGAPLQACCRDPLTGFYRDGFCHTGPEDRGLHTVCAVMTEEFLAFTRTVGNDLSTPVPAYGFPGLEPGDRWCLCVNVNGSYVVDTGHVVAFTDRLQYEVGRIGGYKSLFFSGEGLVCRFRGQGRVWIQTRRLGAFASWIQPFRPVKNRG